MHKGALQDTSIGVPLLLHAVHAVPCRTDTGCVGCDGDVTAAMKALGPAPRVVQLIPTFNASRRGLHEARVAFSGCDSCGSRAVAAATAGGSVAAGVRTGSGTQW